MDTLPEYKLLKFHPDTLQYVRREHGLDKPGQMDAAIDLLDDWLKKQSHFDKKDFPREYLERTIVLDKGSVERAKLQLDKLFTMKASILHFYERPDANTDYEDLHDYYVDALLPKLTKDHYRIYAGKALKDGFTPKIFSLAFGFGALILEYIRANDYCSGFVAILDYRDINAMDLVAQVNISELHQLIVLATEGYQMRVKGIHILTPSKAVELILRILKQIFSKKIGERIRVHKDLESLHECVPKDLLPKELDGDLKSLRELNNDWVEVLSTKENIEYIREMTKAKVNENLRNGYMKSKEDLLGISGSFRTLSVD